MNDKEDLMPAGEFKTHCLRLIDQVYQTGGSLVISKRGKPLARLVPYQEKPIDLYGTLKGVMEVKGDILASVGEDWSADEENI